MEKRPAHAASQPRCARIEFRRASSLVERRSCRPGPPAVHRSLWKSGCRRIAFRLQGRGGGTFDFHRSRTHGPRSRKGNDPGRAGVGKPVRHRMEAFAGRNPAGKPGIDVRIRGNRIPATRTDLAVGSRTMISIGGRLIGVSVRPYLIAEMSGNHNQSLERALQSSMPPHSRAPMRSSSRPTRPTR